MRGPKEKIRLDARLVRMIKASVFEAALKHGKFAGTVGPGAMLQSFVDMGYRYFNPAADVTALRQSFLDAGAIAAALTLP